MVSPIKAALLDKWTLINNGHGGGKDLMLLLMLQETNRYTLPKNNMQITQRPAYFNVRIQSLALSVAHYVLKTTDEQNPYWSRIL